MESNSGGLTLAPVTATRSGIIKSPSLAPISAARARNLSSAAWMSERSAASRSGRHSRSMRAAPPRSIFLGMNSAASGMGGLRYR